MKKEVARALVISLALGAMIGVAGASSIEVKEGNVEIAEVPNPVEEGTYNREPGRADETREVTLAVAEPEPDSNADFDGPVAIDPSIEQKDRYESGERKLLASLPDYVGKLEKGSDGLYRDRHGIVLPEEFRLWSQSEDEDVDFFIALYEVSYDLYDYQQNGEKEQAVVDDEGDKIPWRSNDDSSEDAGWRMD